VQLMSDAVKPVKPINRIVVWEAFDVADPAGAFDADRLKQIVAGLHREVYHNEPGDYLHDRTLPPGVLPRLRPAKLAGLPLLKSK